MYMYMYMYMTVTWCMFMYFCLLLSSHTSPVCIPLLVTLYSRMLMNLHLPPSRFLSLPPPSLSLSSPHYVGELVTKQPLIASMRTVKKETLKLITCWVSKSQDAGMVRCMYVYICVCTLHLSLSISLSPMPCFCL